MKSWIIFLVIVIVVVGVIVLLIGNNEGTEQKGQEGSTLTGNNEDSTVSNTDTGSGTNTDSGPTTYDLSEIEKHDSKDDCWLLIDRKVYDVTDFISKHPGGEAILEGCGKDASLLYNERQREDGSEVGSGTPHSDKARDKLEDYYIGDLE